MFAWTHLSYNTIANSIHHKYTGRTPFTTRSVNPVSTNEALADENSLFIVLLSHKCRNIVSDITKQFSINNERTLCIRISVVN